MDSASLKFFIKQEISHEMDYINLEQHFERMADLPPQSPVGFEYNTMNNLINLEAQQNFTNFCGYPSGDFMNWNNLGKNTGQNEYFDTGDLKFLCDFLDSDVKMENNVPFETHVAKSTNTTTTTTTTFSTVNAASATVAVNAIANTTVASTAAAVNPTFAANAAAVNTRAKTTVAATNPTPAATVAAAAAAYGTETTVSATSASSKLPILPASVSSDSVVCSMQPQPRAILSDTSMASRMPALSRTFFSDTGMIRRVPPQPTTILPAPSIICQVPPSPVVTISRHTGMVIREKASVKAEPERKAIMRRPPMGRFRKSALLELDDIKKYFGMPIIKAAKEMKVGLTVLKKRCRELNITRWPHRKIKSLKTLINNVKGMGLDLREIEMLEEHRKLVERLPHLELNEGAKKLRQACFKNNYKKRRSMGRV